MTRWFDMGGAYERETRAFDAELPHVAELIHGPRDGHEVRVGSWVDVLQDAKDKAEERAFRDLKRYCDAYHEAVVELQIAAIWRAWGGPK